MQTHLCPKRPIFSFSVVVDRIGLWRTCVTIDGEKTCDDTLKDKDVGCTALINATRTLNILFITLAVLGSVTLLLASATEKRWIGLVTTFIIIFTMGTGLACWACWLSYARYAPMGSRTRAPVDGRFQ